MNACPSREKLELMTSQQLDPVDQAAIGTHVGSCTMCQGTIAALRGGQTQDWQPPVAEEPEPFERRSKLPAELRDHPRYRVTSILGRGGMGTVYRAEHRLLDRPVVLKVIRPELLDNPGIVQRFEREARLAAKMAHPNVVSVYEAEQLGRSQLLVMEYVEGVNLHELVSQRGLLPVAESCELVRQAALGLQHIYEQQLVHRDIKPANLLVSPGGVVKILDLGLATLKSGPVGSELTAKRQFVGTVDYAAPEQWESSRDVDIRANIYSLGCTLYYLLTGQSPFPCSKYSTTMQQMWAHSQAPRPPVRELRPDVPDAVAAIVERMLAKNLQERFANPAEVVESLSPFVADCNLAEFVRTARRTTTTSRIELSRISSATPHESVARPRAKSGRRNWLLAAGGVAVAILIVVLLAAFRGNREPAPNEGTKPAAPASGFTGPPIKVGVLHSRTGTMAISERPVIDATLLAIKEINDSGGVLGRKVEAVVEDGESDWAKFSSKAEKLIVEDSVCTIFGCWTSASRKTVLPVLQRHNHLLFYPVQYEGLEQSPHIVYTGAAPNQQIIPAVKWAVSALHKRKLFLVGSDYVFPRCANAIIRETAAALEADVVGEEYRIVGSSDFAEVVDKIVAAQPDLILNTINGDSNVAFFRALRAAGVKSDTIPTISFSISDQELSSLSTKDIVGDYAAWSYFQSVDRPQNRASIERFHERYGEERAVSDPMEAAYLAVHLWAQAVAKAGRDEVQAIRDAVKGMRFDAPEGLVQVDPETQHLSKVFRVGQIAPEGHFDIVYSPEAPITPSPYPNPSSRTRADWDAFLMDLHLRWNGDWSNPER